MVSEMLTDEELINLTGFTQASAQCRQLKAQGIHFHKRGDGKPVVTWTAVNYPFMKKSVANDDSPNFEALSNA
ncbi:DUF4224 domain-containing protein [Shewanella sp. Isolate11]|uniref:DUF4224 domain-containing protein n=1 Tax=Shewanella sp. Isolate11 TaxID=2908530 RepID=UPI001EFC49BA|nr:DUF4224 domain-containing protein [Shewanella sp. Isolate11]MCG9697459.1 DUF4224 domain-containing protein [Shewanella sp. Isolate11]